MCILISDRHAQNAMLQCEGDGLTQLSFAVYVPRDWIVEVPETFWLFGSGTPPWPSNRDWTANTVWLSMPRGEEEEKEKSG